MPYSAVARAELNARFGQLARIERQAGENNAAERKKARMAGRIHIRRRHGGDEGSINLAHEKCSEGSGNTVLRETEQ